MSNRFTPINPGSDIEQVIAIMNKNFAELDAEANAKVFYGQNNQVVVNEGQLPNSLGTGMLLRDTTGTPAIAMYVDNAGKPVLKVAQTGKNAVTGIGADLIFNSTQDTFKVVGTIRGVFPSVVVSSVSAGTFKTQVQTVTYPHGLNYTPAILPFVDDGSGTLYQLPYIVNTGNGTTASWSTYDIASDANNLTLTTSLCCYGTGNNAIPLNIKCYLLQETAN